MAEMATRTIWVLLLVAGLVLAPASALAQEQERPIIDGKRVALVIGNSNYIEDPMWKRLSNAALDAETIAHQLRNPVGGDGSFDVLLLVDADNETMRAGIERFAALAKEADVALVYFSGHGFMFNLKNYIVPIDAPQAISERTIDRSYIDMADVIAAGQSKGISLFFLDACRTTDALKNTGEDNQATKFGTIKARGSAVFYSTSDREPAYDAVPPGTQRSPFARAVLRSLQRPGLEFSVFSKDVTAAVYRETTGLNPSQYPYLGSQMFQDFYFLPPSLPQYTSANGTASVQPAPTEARPPDRIEEPRHSAPASPRAPPVDAQGSEAIDVIFTEEGFAKCMRGDLVIDGVRMSPQTCRDFVSDTEPEPAAGPMVAYSPSILIALPAMTPLDIAAELIDRTDDELLILDILEDYSPERLHALSDQGDPVAAYILGQMYFDGVGVFRNLHTAGEQFEKSAASGHPAGQYGLGRFLERMIFEYNEPVEDGGRITDLYRASFAQGFGKAGVRLADLYADGRVALPDDNPDENIDIWKTMAARGHAGSRYELMVREIDADAQFASLAADARGANGEAALWLCRYDDQRQALRERFDHCVYAASRGHEMAVIAMATDLYSQGDLNLSRSDLAYWARLAIGSPLLPDQWLPCIEAIADTGQITAACDLSGKGP